MYKISLLKIVLAILLVLIGVSIGYAEWKIWSRSKGVKNLSTNSFQQQVQQEKAAENNKPETHSFDTSDWNIFSSELGFSLKYPVWSKNPNASFPQRLRTGHHSPNVLISP